MRLAGADGATATTMAPPVTARGPVRVQLLAIEHQLGRLIPPLPPI